MLCLWWRSTLGLPKGICRWKSNAAIVFLMNIGINEHFSITALWQENRNLKQVRSKEKAKISNKNCLRTYSEQQDGKEVEDDPFCSICLSLRSHCFTVWGSALLEWMLQLCKLQNTKTMKSCHILAYCFINTNILCWFFLNLDSKLTNKALRVCSIEWKLKFSFDFANKARIF